ncbi:MAG TPA: 4'-phosphopantetheinyl transferase superfamily protein [Elusimicrobiota bacterium]|jgi:1-acyl-sn-glycerol-3-phosphate acyltransferase/phosphopantetheinyl transferase (holo-ACP synthase)|nr:4'-phosphopantetheinyl transferase superfamily protein [Elusimicrobiota bacterium]
MALAPEDLKALRRQWRVSRAAAVPLSFFVAAAARLRFGYRLPDDIRELRAELWRKLDAHDGPVIWAANHLTLIDSFLVYWALFPLSRSLEDRRIPWSTPEYTNYYRLGGPWKSSFIRGLLYLCRCIPFLRGGEDAAAEAFRQNAFDKCVWLLREGAAVFVYPEAGRSRSGWFEARRPKDFLGKLALEVPSAKFLCVYMRAETQLGTTVRPPEGDRFRLEVDLIDGARPGETNPREISQRLFDRLADLQREWWEGSAMPRNCGGNDVIDLKSPLLREDFSDDLADADPEWLERHLTPRELSYWTAAKPDDRFRVFWRFFCAKEACHKALARAGLIVSNGAFREIEADLFRRKAVHVSTGLQLDVRFTDDDADKLHCVAVLRGGWIGDEENPGDVVWDVAEVPAGASPGAFARERALDFIAQSNDEIGSSARLALSESGGLPSVLWKGRPRDWSLSLSHSGRYAACSFMIS